MLLLVALLERSAAASIKQNQPSLTAFDCDQPDEVRVATVPIDCQHNTQDLRLGESVNISVSKKGLCCGITDTIELSLNIPTQKSDVLIRPNPKV